MVDPDMSPEAVAERRAEYQQAVKRALDLTLSYVDRGIDCGATSPVEHGGSRGVEIPLSPDSSITAFFDPDASEEIVIDSLFVSMGGAYRLIAERQDGCLGVVLYDEHSSWERHLE